jgi:serine/threonine protein kinase
VRLDPETGRERYIAISSRANVQRGRWHAGSQHRALIADWVDQQGDESVSVALKQLSQPLSNKALLAWCNLRHLNVVPLFGEIKHGSVQRLLMPFVNGGSLRDRLDGDLAAGNDSSTTERFQIGVLLDVATALDYLHRNGIIHRDLAARNVLLRNTDGDDVPRALLCGFALTRDVSGDEDSVYTAGSFDVPLQPLAPEQLEDYVHCRDGCRSSAASDVWAFGCLAAEVMLPHVTDFYDPIVCEIEKRDKRGWMLAVFEHIAMQRRTPIDLHRDDLSSALPAVLAIAKCCFEHDERQRPRIDEIRRQLVGAGRPPPPAASRHSRAETLYSDAELLPVNSELEMCQREWLELERDFATKMAALDDGYLKNVFASAFSDMPPISMQMAERLFANVRELRVAADQLHDGLAAVDRTRGTLVAAAAATLAKSRFVERLSAFLASELESQRLLVQLLSKDGDRKATRAREEFVRVLSLVQLKPKVAGHSLSELFARPYRHADAQQRMMVLLAAAATASGDRQSAAAFGALGTQLAAAKSADDKSAQVQHAAQVLAGLTWKRKQMRTNDFDGSERVSNLFVGRGEHRLVLDGVAGVRWQGAKKHEPHTLLLFDDALFIRSRRRRLNSCPSTSPTDNDSVSMCCAEHDAMRTDGEIRLRSRSTSSANRTHCDEGHRTRQ